MLQENHSEARTLGADLRALRKARGMTLVELADQLGRSIGWLSQVERDKSTPDPNDLNDIAKALDISVASLLYYETPPDEEGLIVRRDARRPIRSPVPGLAEELLSPDLTDDFEVVHSTFAPGSKQTNWVQRGTQEIAYIVSGSLRVWVQDYVFDLEPGDSIRLRGQPFRWANPNHETCVAIWVIAPPVY